MKPTIIITIVLLSIFSRHTLTAQQKWSLNQCISFAIHNNVNLKEYEIQQKLAHENLNQSKRNLLPGISASSNAGISYGRSVDPNTNDILNETEFFNNSYNINASITIFDGFRLLNTIRYEKFRKQVSEFNRLNAIDDLAFSVMTSFFDVIYYQGMLKITEEQVETSKLNFKAIQKQVEVGIKAKADLLEMQANLEMEELRKIQMENNLASATLQLKQHMNLTGDEALNLIEENGTVLSEELPGQATLFSAFTQWSPNYQSVVAEVKASEKNLAISRAGLFPSLSFGASINTGYYETNTDTLGNIINFGDQLKNNKSQYVGASLNIPIFNRWATRSSIKKAKLEVEQARNRLESEKQKLYFEMANNLNELEALGKEHAQYEKQKEADKLAFLAAERKFEQGLINVVDFYIAKNRYATSSSQVFRAGLQWEIKKKTLDFYKGQRFWEVINTGN